MGANSKIEWCDHTFNPWTGCQAVSEACAFCYAETLEKRFGHHNRWGPHGVRQITSEAYWQQPLRWNAAAAASGQVTMVFCASLADVFDNRAPPGARARLWHLIHQTPSLTWLLLTKRPGNIAGMLPDEKEGLPSWGFGWPNVALGTTVEDQPAAEARLPHLLSVPARWRFLSCEPLLGPLDLRAACRFPGRDYSQKPMDWVIAGGESGPHARPTNPQWFRDLRDDCDRAEVPFFFKQWGEWVSVSEVAGDGPHFTFPDHRSVRRVGKKLAGSTLDGREHKAVFHA